MSTIVVSLKLLVLQVILFQFQKPEINNCEWQQSVCTQTLAKRLRAN